MLLDLLLVAILLALAALGAWRGAAASGTGLVALLAGYAGAVAAAVGLGSWVEHALVVSPLVALAVAGTLGFVAAWLVASSLGDVLVAWDRVRVETRGGRGLADRVLGGLFGAARGGLVVVLLALLVGWLDAARDLGAVEGLAAVPDATQSAVAGVSGDLVEVAVGAALADGGPAGEVAARITARPAATLGRVQELVEDERITALLSDKLLWTLVQNDSIDYAMNRNAVRAIVLDPEMRARFADLGLVEEAAREDSVLFRDRLAGVFAEVAPRVRRLHTDPEIQALASDPEIIGLVEAGDTLALIGHPRIRRVVDRASRDL